MNVALLVILFSVSLFAQDQSAITAAEAACGAKETQFDAKQDTIHHPTPQPEPGKALVYVIEDLGQCPGCAPNSYAWSTGVEDALTRVGVNGAWVGANRGSSYIAFSIDPGDHHLCANWQSSLESRSHAFAMAGFTAQEGKSTTSGSDFSPGTGITPSIWIRSTRIKANIWWRSRPSACGTRRK
jgi:hypothetical protein